jgi:hypothetical protein
MTLKRLDRSKPPPGWRWRPPCDGDVGRHEAGPIDISYAWEEYDEDTAPAIEDTLAQLVEALWDADIFPESWVECSESVVTRTIAEWIESGEWRK